VPRTAFFFFCFFLFFFSIVFEDRRPRCRRRRTSSCAPKKKKKKRRRRVLELEFKVHPEPERGRAGPQRVLDEKKDDRRHGKKKECSAGRVHGYQVESDPSQAGVPRAESTTRAARGG